MCYSGYKKPPVYRPKILRKFITPIIETYNTDIFHTMDRLCRLRRPQYIYTPGT